jgi:hypothetical protein
VIDETEAEAHKLRAVEDRKKILTTPLITSLLLGKSASTFAVETPAKRNAACLEVTPEKVPCPTFRIDEDDDDDEEKNKDGDDCVPHEAVKIDVVSKAVGKRLGVFVKNNGVDEKAKAVIINAGDTVAVKLMDKGLSSRVRNPSAYLAKAARNEAAAAATEEEAKRRWGGEGTEAYEFAEDYDGAAGYDGPEGYGGTGGYEGTGGDDGAEGHEGTEGYGGEGNYGSDDRNQEGYGGHEGVDSYESAGVYEGAEGPQSASQGYEGAEGCKDDENHWWGEEPGWAEQDEGWPDEQW